MPGWLSALAGLQSAVSRKLVAQWKSCLLLAFVPAGAAAAVLFWMIEAYWASSAFVAGRAAVIVCAAAVIAFLFSLATGRMVRLLIGRDAPPRRLTAVGAGPADTPAVIASFGLIGIVGGAMVLQACAEWIVTQAFVVPGSDRVARSILALLNTAILIGTYFALGRLALVYPARALDDARPLTTLWRLTDGHAATLFLLTAAAPLALFALTALPALWWAGAIAGPFPAGLSLAEAPDLTAHAYLVVPALWVGLLAWWTLMAGGLAVAWETFSEPLDRVGSNASTAPPAA